MRRVAPAILLLFVAAACGGAPPIDEPTTIPESIAVRTDAFNDGRAIPDVYACPRDQSLPVHWDNVPEGAVELAVALEDADAPGGTFQHWIVFGIPPDVREFGLNRVPAGLKVARNDFGDRGYGGPCPPRGDAAHQYVLTVVALRGMVTLPDGAPADEVRRALDARAIAYGNVSGFYARP